VLSGVGERAGLPLRVHPLAESAAHWDVPDGAVSKVLLDVPPGKVIRASRDPATPQLPEATPAPARADTTASTDTA
jgi:hypothetical protein